MEATRVGADTRPFDEIPVIEIDDNYFLNLPTYLAERAQRLGPVFRRRMPPDFVPMYGAEWIVYLVGPEANRFVLQTRREAFSHEKGWSPNLQGIFEKGLLNTDDPEHDRDRKMMNPAFAIDYMSRYLPIMSRVIRERTRDWARRGEVDLYEEARKITFDIAAEALVGFPAGPDVDRLRQLFFDLLHEGDPDEDWETFQNRLIRIRGELDAMLLRMIAARRERPTDDILGLLVQARDERGEAFTDLQLLGQVHILLVAGHETTTTMGAWLLYLLATHRRHLDRVLAELDRVLAEAHSNGEVTLKTLRATRFLGHCVNETGRLRSPVGNVPRGVLEDVSFGGYLLPAGTRIQLSLAAGHRLPHIFADPDVFDPDRFAPPREEDKKYPYALVPFGGGPRICIGINFAQIEVKALAAHVLRRFRLEPVPGVGVQNVYYGPTAEIPTGMPVRVYDR